VASKKKKVRVAFRKNAQKQKRRRPQDLTRQFERAEAEGTTAGPELAPTSGTIGPESPNVERVRARGDLSRYRTIIETVDDKSGPSEPASGRDDVASRRAVDVDECRLGRVIRVHGLVSIVETDDGQTFPCHVRRLLKSLAIEGRNVVTVGDRVWFRPEASSGGEGLIERVEARQGIITRGYRHRQHIIAANVDQVLIVSAMAEPGLKLPLIDRYLISAEIGGVRPVIVLNKADLVETSLYQWVVGLYTQLGYETILTSASDGRGLEQLRRLLGQGVTAVSGQSGVGKSSLLNAIQPGLNLRVREVSDWTSKGKHTTTTAELIRLETGGFVVDTPGLRQFELWGIVPGELEGHFVEFRPFIPHCRFPDCSHTHEHGCAVKDAVYWGQIHAGRYESYLKLYAQQPLDSD
jgi:ribosome biogenesis GTPase